MHSLIRSFSITLILVVVAGGAFGQARGTPAVAGLRCEGRVDPLGVDATAPAFSWVAAAKHNGQRQTACQVIVASKPELLGEGKADLWDSGKVVSAQTFGLEYRGKPLTSESAVRWRVRIWDEDDRPSAWSKPARFRMGLLAAGDWEAKWIGQREARYRGAPNGYHAQESKTDVVKWVQVDLGHPVVIEQILLYPAKPNN
jgi:alpha-L-rhamnosidase